MVFNPGTQVPGAATTVNEVFFDAMIRHQVGLLRLSGGIRKEVHRLLDATEQDMADKIRSRLAGHKGIDSPASVIRLQRLLKSLQSTRLKAWRQVDEVWLKEIEALAIAEPGITDGVLKTVSPAILETTLPSSQLLRSIAKTRPFEGKTMREWSRNIQVADLRRIEDQIKIGMVQGESSQAIARRVVGTARLKGRDGVTQITRNQAAGISRTAVNAISNATRREYWSANDGLFTKELYTATLDNRTTPICQSLDGRLFDIADGPIPPLHFNCRSIRVAVIDRDAIGSRPARAFTERQLAEEYSRNQGLSRVARTRDAIPRGQKRAFDEFASRRMRELTGRVPAKVSYQEWLSRQSVGFQDDVLGKTKGRLFRKGGLKLDKFVNRAGDEIPLSQLAATNARAFRQAGLNPEDFL